MLIRKAYKFRLNTNTETEQKMAQFAGNTRYLWNQCLGINLRYLNEQQPILWYQEFDWFTKLWKKSDKYNFLKLSPSQTLQQTLKQLERAFRQAFDPSQKNKRLPVFKKKSDGQDSFTYPQGFKIDGRRIFLPKIGWVNFRRSREIDGTVKNVTVSRKGKHWFVAIQVELELPHPVHPSTSIIGVDMGVKRLFTLSNGHFEPPIETDFWLHKLKRLQRSLARKVKFSCNWRKVKEKINRIHTKMANIRHDVLHKATRTLSNNHAMIVLEALQISNMTRSASGTLDKPGKSVKQKAGLNRAILGQSWGLFKDFLGYKQNWAGGQLVFVDPKYTSQTCPVCHHKNKANRQTQAQFP